MTAWRVVLALAAAGACVTDPDKPPPDCPLTVTLGHVVDGRFVAFSPGESLPIVHGFQGFRFVQVTARLDGARDDLGSFSFDVAPRGMETVSLAGAHVPLRPGNAGERYADDLQVFLNDYPEGTLFGLVTQVDAHVRSGTCAGDGSAEVTLIDGRCAQEADGGLDCGDAPDGGSP